MKGREERLTFEEELFTFDAFCFYREEILN
jgi:hypothetical protein